MNRSLKNLESIFSSWAHQSLMRIFANRCIYAVIFIYAVSGVLFAIIAGHPEMMGYSMYLTQWSVIFLFFMPLLAAIFDVLTVATRYKKRRRLAYRRILSAKRFASLFSGLLLLAGLMIFQGTFTSIKNLLPLLNGGFTHDRVHADIDAWLHFGHDPWQLLYAIGGYGFVRTVVEFNYNVLWFVICFGALFFVATSPRADRIRTRYIMMFMFVWIVCGNVLAGFFLSAGPAFYGAVTNDTVRFGGQVAFLAGSDWASSAASYQRYLWALYQSGKAGFGGGVSAFPSVHVALITMNALFVAEYSRRLGVLAAAYVVFVLMSSVYLGWHYAIDGYVSIMVVALGYLCSRSPMPHAIRHRRQVSPTVPIDAVA